MAELLVDAQGTPAAPAAGQSIIYPLSSAVANLKRWSMTDENGKDLTFPAITNASVATQAYTTSEIYLTGSSLHVPPQGLQVGTTCRWRIVATKTAGTGALIWRVRIGTAGSTADAEIINLTQVSAPTSATDTAFVDIEFTVRTNGAAATSRGAVRLNHVLATTGFSSLGTNVQQAAGTAFDSTIGSLIVGVTFNAQTAGAGNVELVDAEMVGV